MGSWVAGVVAVIVAIILVVTGISWVTAFKKTDGGHIAIVRNGGPFDNNRIRVVGGHPQVLQPGSSLTNIGLYSALHEYPSSERYYTITADSKRGDRTGVDVEYHQTRDGVNLGVEGTVYMTLNTDPNVLASFDNKFGTRTFRGLDGVSRNAYGTGDGWNTFLDAIIRPVISNDFKNEFLQFNCDQLIASCAYIQNGAAGANSASLAAVAQQSGQQNGVNLTTIQNDINTSLAEDIRRTLGGAYFTNIHFNLTQLSLPAKLQGAVEDAQAAYAEISKAQAKVAQAKADAAANEQRQAGYSQCPACAQIDTLKAIPSNVTVYAPGAPATVPLTGK